MSSLADIFRKIQSRVRKEIMEFSRTKISKAQIIRDLRKLGIKEGDVLLVHSSLRSIGYVIGGADTVIDALLEVLGSDGTLVLPALSLTGSMMQTLMGNRVFNPKTTPTAVGLIPETFRKRRGVYRSIHPTHSICAFGAKAKYITQGHERCTTTFGKGTPWYKIMELNGKILGIGVDLGPVTFYHVIEDILDDFPLNVYTKKRYEVRVIVNDSEEKIMRVKAHNPDVAKTRIDKERGKWIRKYFTDCLHSRGVLNVGLVGEAKSWVINAKDLFNTQMELLKRNITIYTTKEELQKMHSL